MAAKIFNLEGVGLVKVFKRRTNRSLRISIEHDGSVRLSLPMWVPYKTGLVYLLSKKDWILKELPEKNQHLTHGMRIGKAHRLSMAAAVDSPIKAQLVGNEVRVKYPAHLDYAAPAVQLAAKAASIKALRREAESLLPQRLAILAKNNDLSYQSVGFKQMKRRWGSCSSRGEISLNIYLMQLPWHLIDYVLVHELTHTVAMNHGTDFWQLLVNYLPRAKELRKEIRSYRPLLIDQTSMA